MIEWIDSLPSDFLKNGIFITMDIGILGFLGTLIVFMYNRLFSKEKKRKLIEELKTREEYLSI